MLLDFRYIFVRDFSEIILKGFRLPTLLRSRQHAGLSSCFAAFFFEIICICIKTRPEIKTVALINEWLALNKKGALSKYSKCRNKSNELFVTWSKLCDLLKIANHFFPRLCNKILFVATFTRKWIRRELAANESYQTLSFASASLTFDWRNFISQPAPQVLADILSHSCQQVP